MKGKCIKYIIIFLIACNVVSFSVILFFINEIGIVKVTTEFGASYDFFSKKDNSHRILYIEPVGERDLNQLPTEQFNELLDFCSSVKEDDYYYRTSCSPADLLKEIERRDSAKGIQKDEDKRGD